MPDTAANCSEILRLSGWRQRLNDVFAKAASRPFVWGEHDCCLGLAVPAVAEIIGVDLAADFRTYTTARGAMAALSRAGFDSLVDLAAANFDQCPISVARVGDLAAIKADETGWGLGVVMGPRIGVLAPSGFATIDLAKADHAYRVGT